MAQFFWQYAGRQRRSSVERRQLMRAETLPIGLVAGLGPAATIHYYRALLAECDRRTMTLRLLIAHADVGRVLDAAGRGDIDDLASSLKEHAEPLVRAGAAVLAVGAVTPHLALPQLRERITIPIVDLVAAVDAELRRLGVGRVALLGTRATVRSRMFGRLSVEVADPGSERIDRAHALYLDIVERANASEATAAALGALAAELARDLAVDAVVLAGTELALLPPAVWGSTPVLDAAALHVAAILARAAG